MALIGRKDEKRALETALASDKAELVAVIGRRRVGKTFLVRSVYGDRIAFEISGLQNGNTEMQLQNFALAVRYAGLDDAIERPKNWMQAFFELSRLLERRAHPEKVVLFFDEFPWLATRRSDFLQGFGFFWNSWAVKKNVVVVICGSAASWMIHKVINDRGGLHNRVTRLLHLAPFNLRETEQLLHARGIHYPPFQVLEVYLALGGIPMYLELLEAGLSPTENIHRLCFEASGYLRHEFQNLYAALFEHHEAHVAVVRALAAKRQGMTREALLQATKLTDGGAFSKVLEELTLSGFVGRFGAYGKKKKDAVYRLIDPYSLFYLHFIEEALLNPTADFRQIAQSQRYLSWAGFSYENVCLTHLHQIKQALGISGVRTSVHTFYALPEDGLPGAQIDLLIERADRCAHVCEVKFSSTPYAPSKAEIDRWRVRQAVFRHHTGYKFHLFNTLITTFGVAGNTAAGAADQVLVLEDLFREIPA